VFEAFVLPEAVFTNVLRKEQNTVKADSRNESTAFDDALESSESDVLGI
jgi:hypothetical protein